MPQAGPVGTWRGPLALPSGVDLGVRDGTIVGGVSPSGRGGIHGGLASHGWRWSRFMGPTPSCHGVTWQGPVVAWGLFLSHSVRNRKGSAAPGLGAPTLLSVGKQQTAGRCGGRAATRRAPAGCGSWAAGGLSCSRAAVLKVHCVSGPQRAFVLSVHFYHICTENM